MVFDPDLGYRRPAEQQEMIESCEPETIVQGVVAGMRALIAMTPDGSLCPHGLALKQAADDLQIAVEKFNRRHFPEI